jgi:hypothetical protein
MHEILVYCTEEVRDREGQSSALGAAPCSRRRTHISERRLQTAQHVQRLLPRKTPPCRGEVCV